MAGKFGKRTAFYIRFIISFGIFSIIYQMVLVWAIYLFHGVSGNAVRHYLIADLEQLEAAGTSHALAVSFQIMIIAGLIWSLAGEKVIRQAIVPKRVKRRTFIIVQMILLALLAIALIIVFDRMLYHALRAFIVPEVLILEVWLDAFPRSKM